jgi:hypothetical protein
LIVERHMLVRVTCFVLLEKAATKAAMEKEMK